MLTGCLGNKDNKDGEEKDPLQQELDSLKKANSAQAAELEECMALIDQVNEGFRVIKEAEGRFDIQDGNVENGSRDQMLSNMQFVQDKMKENRELIEQLKQRVSASNSKLTALANQINKLEEDYRQQVERIKQLEQELAARDMIIEQQSDQIMSLSEDISNLSAENEQQTAEIAAQERELNKAWFVFGTKKELKENKILEGGEVLQNSNFNKSYFTEIDIRYHKDILLHSKSATLLTAHPTGSYQLTKNGQGEYELHITDPSSFWRASKYLVVQVK